MRKVSPHTILIIFLSFWTTVLAVRGIIFALVRRGIIAAIFVRGYHIHHFVTGFVFLILALVLSSRKKHQKHVPAILLGSGLALVFDEMLFWTRGFFNYWSLVNFCAVGVVGIALAAWYQYSQKRDFTLLLPVRNNRKRWSYVFLPLLLALALLLNWFSYYNVQAAKATSAGRNLFDRDEPR